MINEYYVTGLLRTCSRIRSLSFPCSSCSTSCTSADDSDASLWCDSASEWEGGRKYSSRHTCVYPLLVYREHCETPQGKHIHLNVNLLMIIGLICAVNWTYHPWVHWHFLMCHNWSVIALCLLQLLDLLMNYAHLGAILKKHLQLISKWREFKLKSYPGEWAGRAPQNANKGEHECHCNCNAECLHFRGGLYDLVVKSFQ